MTVRAIDHFVMTVRSIPATCAFYERVLGMRVVHFADDRVALAFGAQKINLHEAGREFEPKAQRPTPGAADFCLLTDVPIEELTRHLEREGVAIEEGPVARAGATGELMSVYFRDPDGNLVEVANPV